MAACESEAGLGSGILDSLVGVRAVGIRLGESVEVRGEVGARTYEQGNKGEERGQMSTTGQ